MLIFSLPRSSSIPRLVLVMLICVAGCLCLFGLHSRAGADEPDYSPLCRELAKSGLEILNSGIAYGVPYVEIKVPLGASVTSICKRVPSLRADFNRCRDKIAFFNALYQIRIDMQLIMVNNPPKSNQLRGDCHGPTERGD